MAKSEIVAADTALEDCTMEQILDYVTEHAPAFAGAVCIPDDGQTCRTMVFTGGNRATSLGLASLAKTVCQKKLMDDMEAKLEPEDEDDDS